MLKINPFNLYEKTVSTILITFVSKIGFGVFYDLVYNPFTKMCPLYKGHTVYKYYKLLALAFKALS